MILILIRIVVDPYIDAPFTRNSPTESMPNPTIPQNHQTTQRFGLFTRRHHCRNCGRSACWRHSAHKAPLPHYGHHDYARVCSDCYPVLLECYRAGRPYTPAMLQQRVQHQQQLGAASSNPYAGPDNTASYSYGVRAWGVVVSCCGVVWYSVCSIRSHCRTIEFVHISTFRWLLS